MARYKGPVERLSRRSGEELFLKPRSETPKSAFERRPYAPGQHGQRRRKLSERGIQLREKQKARYIYGVLERQFVKHFAEAARRPGMTGENLLQILETRLDNIVYRLGFASSRDQARQLVRHGHITLNGKKTNIPSALVKVGDTIGWVESSKELDIFKSAADAIKERAIPAWLSVDEDNLVGRVVAMPSRGDIDRKINESSIIEYYSR